MLRPQVCLSLIALLLLISQAHAVVVIDQNYTPTPTGFNANLTNGLAVGNAQTFTVGIGGTLDGVDVVASLATEARILATSGGVPISSLVSGSVISTVLATSTAVTDLGGGVLNFDFSAAGLVVAPGDVLGLELRGPGGLWLGTSGNGYTNGSSFFFTTASNPPTPVWTGSSTVDRLFRTYVETGSTSSAAAPEPAAALLVICGLAGFLRRSQTRRA